MQKNMLRILLLSAAMSLCLILSASVAFGQCGADGKQPCGSTKKTIPTKKTTPTTKPITKPKTTTQKPQTTFKTQSKFVPLASKIELVGIPAGSYVMGNDGEWGALPSHKININYNFYIGKYEVTQSQYKSVIGNNPSTFSGCGGNCPVESISWDEAKEFIRKLNTLQNDYEYRLPSEAEWEYAAGTEYWLGTEPTSKYSDLISWSSVNSGKKTHPIGQKRENELGLHDIFGNVFEFCEDIYNKRNTFYGAKPSSDGLTTDGSANLSIGDLSQHVIRGGSWGNIGWTSHSTGGVPHDTPSSNIGFRVVAKAK